MSAVHRYATMKPHAPVTPPGPGQTVACLTRLKSPMSLQKKNPRVGFQPFYSRHPPSKNEYIHPFFNLAQIHIDRMFNVNVITVSLSDALLDLSQSHIPEFHRSTGEHKGFDCRRM